jgi:hypothetical protein
MGRTPLQPDAREMVPRNGECFLAPCATVPQEAAVTAPRQPRLFLCGNAMPKSLPRNHGQRARRAPGTDRRVLTGRRRQDRRQSGSSWIARKGRHRSPTQPEPHPRLGVPATPAPGLGQGEGASVPRSSVDVRAAPRLGQRSVHRAPSRRPLGRDVDSGRGPQGGAPWLR